MFGVSLPSLIDGESGASPGPEVTPPADVSADDLFEVLRSSRRRRAIRAVADLGEVDLGDLAEVVASEEYECTIRELTHQQRKRVYVSLYQAHLPKLDKSGVVDVTDRDQVIEANDATDAAVELIASAGEITEDPR